ARRARIARLGDAAADQHGRRRDRADEPAARRQPPDHEPDGGGRDGERDGPPAGADRLPPRGGGWLRAHPGALYPDGAPAAIRRTHEGVEPRHRSAGAGGPGRRMIEATIALLAAAAVLLGGWALSAFLQRRAEAQALLQHRLVTVA